MGHIKKLVQDCNAPSIRYSLAPSAISDAVPEPPPMTELEFWAALVQDYPSTATRLPTLTTTKIRSGIPPPLRGVVWTSMAGARDRSLEDAFDNLLGEKSPYEGIINKDVGRSFPGVELFRDAEGEGQKMLGRVLKCFSLHDKDIGYCQGLGFLVGPLLMNMGEKEAFCVLVRLMDHYHLRPSFLPSLSGLHMRIFQFSSLLKQHQPELSQHLSDLGIEPAYLSQWFLSCFAVTCPLPLLFRIYDVIFAEGANETVMRVALALMRRNEEKMLATTEFEEVMQLLLGRALWDSYGCNPDDLVDDFTGLGGLITHAKLSDLEKEFHNQSSESVGEKAGFLPDVQAAASRFLGRLWAPSSSHGHTPSKSTSTLSPQSAEKDGGHGTSLLSRPGSFLRRSPSKQSIGTLNESDGQADTMSFKSIKHPDSLRTVSIATGHSVPPGMSKEERDMHGQIEDLLMALSEMQREHQQLAAMLQKEREERSEDHRVVRQLVIHLTNSNRQIGRQQELNELLEKVQERLDTNARFSASFETKAQLRITLSRTREQLSASENSCRELTARLEIAESALAAFTSESEDLRSEVKELRVRVNEEFKARQKLEHTITELKAEARSMERKHRDRAQRAETSIDQMPSMVGGNGLRELKLGRRDSTSSIQSIRSVKFATRALATKEVLSTPQHEVVPEEALLLELVNSKTAEAQARQEIDELKRALNINTRKSDAMLAQLRKEIDAAKLEVEKSRQEAQAAHAAADAARAEASAKAEAAAKLFLGTSTNEGLSIPTTPAAYDSDNRSIGTNSDLPTPATPTEADAKPKKSETVSSGWFWSRRTASTTKAAVTPPTE
ncbi:hypothetical protein M433DRAFT_61196 [Acidomyces richmondensis BFW]|nr:MAG: hypothetical protein FE78DRAFT_148556 [Acidomyces sp. 'richmondensis']KYG48378.1 hypothetical protein M433DRAFT_61196 [Acidomyces richmondensis BFW]